MEAASFNQIISGIPLRFTSYTIFIVIRTAASGKTYVNRLYSETQTMLPIIPPRTIGILTVNADNI